MLFAAIATIATILKKIKKKKKKRMLVFKLQGAAVCGVYSYLWEEFALCVGCYLQMHHTNITTGRIGRPIQTAAHRKLIQCYFHLGSVHSPFKACPHVF